MRLPLGQIYKFIYECLREEFDFSLGGKYSTLVNAVRSTYLLLLGVQIYTSRLSSRLVFLPRNSEIPRAYPENRPKEWILSVLSA